MRQSQGPFGDKEPIETESKRLTPSIGLLHDSDQPTDSSNEDFLFHLYRGSELLQDNRVHEAKEELERALHLQPRDSKGQDLLAVVYFRLGLYPRAIQIYEQLRRRNASDTALLLNLALCYLKTGQPQAARRDLEQLLGLNPNHSRAWGYLGLACERLGDLAQAERAFRQGGHTQMANRIAARRDHADVPDDLQPSREVRDVAYAAYQELDAGELSFALADPTRESNGEEAAAQSWRPVELGQMQRRSDRPPADTKKPDTKDGPHLAPLDETNAPAPEAANAAPLTPRRQQAHPHHAGVAMTPSIPQLGVPQSLNRRPTLIAPEGAPPAHEAGLASELSLVDRIPSHAPTSFTLDDAGVLSMPTASPRRPVVAVPSPFGPPKSHDVPSIEDRRRTLPPPLSSPGSAPPPAGPLPAQMQLQPPAPAREPSMPPSTPLGIGPAEMEPRRESVRRGTVTSASSRDAAVSASDDGLDEDGNVRVGPSSASTVRFPQAPGVALHRSGTALVRISAEVGFAARLESFRAQNSGTRMHLLERHMKGKPTGEAFGGVSSPMVLATGEGQLVLAARPGRKLTAFTINGEMCFAREDVLLGFGGGIQFENGRLTTGEGEFVPVVQLRGDGAVLFEAIGDVLTLDVRSDRSLSVRREVILGWFGRLVPRAIAPSDAPCGQRGLIAFAGEGRVLVSSS